MLDFDRSVITAEMIDKEYMALRARREYVPAEELLKRGLDLFPKDKQLLINMAMLLKNRRQHHNALPFFARALLEDQGDIRTRMQLGTTLIQCKLFYEAEGVYLKADDENHSDIRLFTAIGNLYQVAGEAGRSAHDFEYAAACFGHAAGLSPEDRYAQKRYSEVRELYGVTYSLQGWDNFVRHMEKIIEDSCDSDFENALIFRFGG